MIVKKIQGPHSQDGDTNSCWDNAEQTNTVGIHCSYDGDDGTSTVLRLTTTKDESRLGFTKNTKKRSLRSSNLEGKSLARALFPVTKRRK